MTTARAILVSALLIAVAVVGAAWLATSYQAKAGRYEMANTGGGSTMRLDRQTGDMISCQGESCNAAVKDGAIQLRKDVELIPAPPPGFVLEQPAGQ